MPIADLKSVHLHYELTGAVPGDVIVLINSLGSDLRMWGKLLPRFEQEFSVIRFDTRGHGKTIGTPSPYSIDTLGGDLLCLLDQLSVDRVNICGASLGGLIALWTAIHAPNRVHRVILANTAARIGTPEFWEERIDAVRCFGMVSQAVATVDRWFTPEYRENHPSEMEFIREMIAATPANSYIACCAALRDADLLPRIGEIESPCLVITGKHDKATPPVDGQALHSGLKNSSYLELNASHLSAWEAHEKFGEAALTFFQQKGRTDGRSKALLDRYEGTARSTR